MACQNHVEVEEGVRPCARCGAFFCTDCTVELQGRWFCARCKNEQLLDLRSGTDRWNLEYAHLGRRFLAMWIDNIIISMPAGLLMGGAMVAAIVNLGANFMETHPYLFWGAYGAYVLTLMTASVVYEALMTGKKNGQTLGKTALKIRVVRPDGSPISMKQAWGRAAARQLFLFLQLFDYLTAFFTKEKTCIHDMLAKTRVVRAE